MLTGGIDLGGSKIEARLFDADWHVIESRRVATPREDYKQLVQAVMDQINDLNKTADQAGIPIGIGLPGLIDSNTGCVLVANLCANGHTLATDIAARSNAAPIFIKDSQAFALSEAVLGSGRSQRSVFGLIIGSSVAGAHVFDGQLVTGANGFAGEIGHLPLPAAMVARHGLPILPCGCGRNACFETLVSGPGLSRLAEHLIGEAASAREIAARSAKGDPNAGRVLDLWFVVVAEMIDTVIMTIDPDCIVLGGGLSGIPQVVPKLESKLATRMMAGMRRPNVYLAEGGESSGTRGAALAARRAVIPAA